MPRGPASQAATWAARRAETGKGTLVVFALALVAWWLQAAALPLAPGRDLGTYLGAYLQLFHEHPIDLGYVLGHIMLVDVLRDPLRFRVRLHGTEMVMRTNYDLTGKLLDELPHAEYRKYVLERCRDLIADARPLRVEQNRPIGGRLHRYEAVWLPLSEDGKTVTMLMCGLIYHND